MRVIGLTGGIATGKSAVSAMLRALGAKVIDADAVAREVVEPGEPALQEIAARFPGVVGADGRLDRQELGRRIFADPREREALNAIVHPRIQERVREKIDALARAGEQLVVYDVPLLFENRLEQWMGGVIVVTAPREAQVARLAQRNGLSRADAEARIDAQMPLEEKVRRATWVIDNSGDLAGTERQVERLWASLRASG